MTTAAAPSQHHGQAVSVEALIADRTYGSGEIFGHGQAAIGTGFDPLDRVLGGGLRPGDLVLVAGEPGIGKTIATLQWARSMAHTGRDVIYVCYEHGPTLLLSRLLALEVGLAAPEDVSGVEYTSEQIRNTLLDGHSLQPLAQRLPLLRLALDRIECYGERLKFVRGSGAHTDITALRTLIKARQRPPILVLDYLQKVAVHPEPDTENEKVLRIGESLKELALTLEIPVVAVAAATAPGLEASRLRMKHLRGSSALGYECDVAIVMNEKYDIVSKAHVAFDTVRAATFRNSVVFTVEKNRGGRANVDLEFRKHFSNYRFDPVGSYVAERLIDEKVTIE